MPLGEFSIIFFEFLGDFWRKSQKLAMKEKLGKKIIIIGPLRNSKGHLHRGKVLCRREGCLAAVKPRDKKTTPRVCCNVAMLCRSEVIVYSGPKFLFLF